MMAFDQLPNDTLFDVEEEYIRPEGLSLQNRPPYKKIREVLNLHSNNLKIQFRNLSRKIKGVDTEFFDRYTYDNKGNLILANPNIEKSVGYIANNFTCWHCINKQGKFVIPPDFYKLQNEMIYRAFFGSMDGIENKSRNADSQNAWEWIPYEYFIEPCTLKLDFTINHSDGESIDFSGGGYGVLSENVGVIRNIDTYWNKPIYQIPGGLYGITEGRFNLIVDYIYTKTKQVNSNPPEILNREIKLAKYGPGIDCWITSPEQAKRYRYWTVSSVFNEDTGTTTLDDKSDYAEIMCGLGCADLGDFALGGGVEIADEYDFPRGTVVCTQMEIFKQPNGTTTTYFESWAVNTQMRYFYSGSLPEYLLGKPGNKEIEDKYNPLVIREEIGGPNHIKEITILPTKSLRVFPPTVPKETFSVNPLGVYSFEQTSTANKGFIRTRLFTKHNCKIPPQKCSVDEPITLMRKYSDPGSGIPKEEIIEPENFKDAYVILTSNKSASGSITFKRLPCEG
jgi:hypothetical protein